MEKPSRGESYSLPKWQAVGFKKIRGAPQRTKAKDIPPCSPVCCWVPRSAEWSYVRCHSGWETQVRVGRDRKLSSQSLLQFHFIYTDPHSFSVLMLFVWGVGSQEKQSNNKGGQWSWVRKTWLNPSSSTWFWTWVISLSFLHLSFFTIMTCRVVIESEWPWED